MTKPSPSSLWLLRGLITGDSWKGLFGLMAGWRLQIFSAAGRAQQWMVLPEAVLCLRDWGETSEASLLSLYLQSLGCKHNTCNYVASWVFIMSWSVMTLIVLMTIGIFECFYCIPIMALSTERIGEVVLLQVAEHPAIIDAAGASVYPFGAIIFININPAASRQLLQLWEPFLEAEVHSACAQVRSAVPGRWCPSSLAWSSPQPVTHGTW